LLDDSAKARLRAMSLLSASLVRAGRNDLSTCRLHACCAVLTVLGVIVIFLFPIHSGPFSATYGPATALRAARAAIATFTAIVAACVLPIIIPASLLLIAFLVSLLLFSHADSGDLMPAADTVCITCELRC
jgi:hypothetical protein